MFIHFEDSISFWLDANISQHTVVRIKKLAETLEEEHVRIEFSWVFMLDTEEEIVKLLALALIDETTKLFLDILNFPWVSKVIFFHSDWVKDDFILSRLQISVAEILDFWQGIIDKLIFDIFSWIEVLLNFLLGFEPVVVLWAVIDAQLFVFLDDFMRKQI